MGLSTLEIVRIEAKLVMPGFEFNIAEAFIFDGKCGKLVGANLLLKEYYQRHQVDLHADPDDPQAQFYGFVVGCYDA